MITMFQSKIQGGGHDDDDAKPLLAAKISGVSEQARIGRQGIPMSFP
jgi:hypothetical protein